MNLNTREARERHLRMKLTDDVVEVLNGRAGDIDQDLANGEGLGRQWSAEVGFFAGSPVKDPVP